jgi:hypothetical protein
LIGLGFFQKKKKGGIVKGQCQKFCILQNTYLTVLKNMVSWQIQIEEKIKFPVP